VRSVTHLFEGRAWEKGLSLTVFATSGPVAVAGDQFRLEQTFINLIDNAIKYTDSGAIRVALEKDGGSAVVSVCDTGIGIPAHLLGRIFERFFVVDKSRSRQSGGTGLGLSIVKHTVLLHNGAIDAKPLSPCGTCFTVSLPLLRP
jgi:two-component system phosphate regulon sensor histidine kinase PhoR